MATTNAQIGSTCAYEKMHPNECSIKTFFAEKVIFLTGATGFVGKALLEKLLRTCPAVTRIFVLIRPRTKQSIEERFNKLLENPVCNTFSFVVYHRLICEAKNCLSRRSLSPRSSRTFRKIFAPLHLRARARTRP